MSSSRTSILRRAAPALLIVLAVCVLVPRAVAGERTSDVEPLWHIDASPDAQFVAADERGSVVTGSYGEIVATDQIGGSMWSVSVTTDVERVLLPPSVSTSSVVVPIERSRVVAIDRASGRERWAEPITDVVAVGSSESGDVVSVLTRTRVELRVGSTGALVWVFEQPVDAAIPEVLAAAPLVTVRPSAVVVAWTDTAAHLQVFDPVDGRLLWVREQQNNTSAPVVADHAVFVAENRHRTADRKDLASVILRLDLATGAVEWRRRARGIFLPGFVGDVEGTLVAIVDFRGRVFALDAASGRMRWRRGTGAEQYTNEVHVVGDVVAFTTYGTGLVILDRRDGAPVENESPGRAQPWSIIRGSAATGDQLYLLTHPNGGSGEQDAVLVMLPAGPDGSAPGFGLDLRPDG